jgi:hypothetical protein
MDPTWGWTGNLNSIQKMIRAERKFLPIILDKLDLEVVDIQLEELVESPSLHLRRVLDHLELPWEEACLSPEQNDRLVLTLSHAQVRNPFNRKGIGRWENYRKFFDESWTGLA